MCVSQPKSCTQRIACIHEMQQLRFSTSKTILYLIISALFTTVSTRCLCWCWCLAFIQVFRDGIEIRLHSIDWRIFFSRLVSRYYRRLGLHQFIFHVTHHTLHLKHSRSYSRFVPFSSRYSCLFSFTLVDCFAKKKKKRKTNTNQ